MLGVIWLHDKLCCPLRCSVLGQKAPVIFGCLSCFSGEASESYQQAGKPNNGQVLLVGSGT